MSSYIPEHYFGHIPGTYPMQYGLLPWPEHLKPEKAAPDESNGLPKNPLAMPALVDAGGVFFLTLSVHDRLGIATTIERLIGLLDEMDGDENLEPYLAGYHDLDGDREGDGGTQGKDEDFEPSLGSVQWHPHSQENLAFGVRMPPSNDLRRTRDCSQESWASGSGDDREEECEDEGAQDDREYSLGWQDEGNQALLRGGDGDYEADLGTTEEIDQLRRLEIAAGVMAGLDEPCLGWAESAGKGIVGQQNCLDDREHVDEREGDPAEAGIGDPDGLAWVLSPSTMGRAQARPIKNPTLPPAMYPDQFSCIGDGNCLEPEIMDGGRIIVDKKAAYGPGDFVIIFRDPATVGRGDHVWKIKRFVSEDANFIVAETLNPPRKLAFRKSEVVAVWHAEPAPVDYVPGQKVTDAMLVEKATKQPDGTIMRRFEPRDDDAFIPELDPANWRAMHYRAANGRLQ